MQGSPVARPLNCRRQVLLAERRASCNRLLSRKHGHAAQRTITMRRDTAMLCSAAC